MNMRGIILLIILLALVRGQGYCFDDKITHPDLTKQAILISNLPNYLVNYLGQLSGIDTSIYGPSRGNSFQYKKIQEWLWTGSTDEDALSTCRASSHFHNPIHVGDWTQSLMNDSDFVDYFCRNTQRYSDVTWATGFTYPAPGGNKITPIGQANGWDNARQYYYNALTTTDTYSNSSGTSKDNQFVLTFRSLGMVMHLLQDMAVPAHVRNDMTSHLYDKDILTLGPNPFEKYVKKYNSAISNTPVIPSVSMYTKLTNFWDTNIYNGIEPDSTRYAGIGLAEYTNANFLSDFTIFDQNPTAVHYFPYPSSSSVSTGTKQIANPFMPGTTVPRQYYVKTSDGEAGYLLAGVGYLDAKAPGIIGNTTKRIPPMDNNVHSDYAQLLLPRAVGYSAALLDYFFRGTLTLTVATPTDITFSSIKVTAVNSTPNENMGIGEASLVIRYKALAESGTGPVKTLGSASADYSYKVSTLTNVDLSNAQILTFDFSADVLPMNFSEMTMQLVYKGKLGNEDGAVAVSAPKAITGIYSNLDLTLPPSGIYAKSSGNSSDATFNELRLTALSNIPGSLSGGTIQLALRYRIATSDPFLLQPGNTEPANGSAYVFRINEKNGVNTLSQGAPTELIFDLSTAPLPVRATDVELSVIYIDTATSMPVAMGYRDISEATPIDLFNNTDYACISNTWYVAGSPDARAAADLAGNRNGLDDDTDTFHHDFTTIYLKLSPMDNPVRASATTFDFLEQGPVKPASMQRMGFVLTDHQFKTSFLPNWVHVEYPRDGWTRTEAATLDSATAVNILTNAAGVFSPPPMFNMRGNLMWGSAGSAYDNGRLPANSICNWSTLPPTTTP